MTMPLCWTPREVLQIINTEAEAIPSVVFRAVHSARVLRVGGFIGTNFHELLEILSVKINLVGGS